MKRSYLAIIIISIALIIDQWVKIWVKLNMHLHESFNVLGEWFQFHFIENPGMAFGITWGLGIGKIALSLFRLVAIVFLAIYLSGIIKRKLSYSLIIGFSLILAGAAGNLIDGMFYGMIFNESTAETIAGVTSFGSGYAGFLQGLVVDMLYFPLFEGTFPTWFPLWAGEKFTFFSFIFNIADACVFCGVVTVIICYKSFVTDLNRNKKTATTEILPEASPVLETQGEADDLVG